MAGRPLLPGQVLHVLAESVLEVDVIGLFRRLADGEVKHVGIVADENPPSFCAHTIENHGCGLASSHRCRVAEPGRPLSSSGTLFATVGEYRIAGDTRSDMARHDHSSTHMWCMQSQVGDQRLGALGPVQVTPKNH